MKPIVPVEKLTDHFLQETTSLSQARSIFRGVWLIGHNEPETKTRNESESHPYRAPAKRIEPEQLVPVIVRILPGPPFGDEEAHFVKSSHEMALARQRMNDSPAPKMLHALGRHKQIHAIVEEYICGIPIAAICGKLAESGSQMPIPMALAVGRGLLALWTQALARGLHVTAHLKDIFIQNTGRIRILPTHSVELSRHVVGAALFSLQDLVDMTSPEEVRGEYPDERSLMYYVGTLLYQLIGGITPTDVQFQMRLFEKLSQITQNDAPPLRTYRPDVHPVVSSFIHRCLARDRNDRLPDWSAMLEAYAGMQALFPPVGNADIWTYAKTIIPNHPLEMPPTIELPSHVDKLPNRDYVPMNILETEVRSRLKAPVRSLPSAVAPTLDPNLVYGRIDARPMYPVSDGLLIDARPVTRAELERCFYALRRPLPAALETSATTSANAPCVLISHEVAEMYAHWAGKRLPTETEWEAAATTLGAGQLELGKVWEWTSTPHEQDGWVIRGGRWRDQFTMPAKPENRSFATNAAADVGFRCVADRAADEMP